MGEIGARQLRHFPRRISQLSTGMLSYGRIFAPHLGHAEAGKTMDFPSGSRRMQTFRKLPIISPKAKVNAPTSPEGSMNRMCHKRGYTTTHTAPPRDPWLTPLLGD